MSFEHGHKLAHYEILEPIGRGGMGEVYRAKDSKLGRDVAIKVLPDEFAQDEERLRRFQREAKVLAALNHPNIASIYGLEQSANTHYLVLELVPGETLADRIARGPIPIDEALDIATKIAEALEEAHEQGIVHRDLKPGNIKQTPDDKVKVLDFGLAKAFADESSEGDAASSMSPTLTRDATRVGVILGTAAYMSPEQAKGKRVDKRTDIFAFGAVLYEMLTGKKAFPGEDVSDVLATVIKSEPDWSGIPAQTPLRIRELLARCLRKDPARRLHAAADARIEIEEANLRPELDGEVSRASGYMPVKVAAAVALLLAAITGASVFGLMRAGADAPRVTRFSIATPPDATMSIDKSLALSPDGRLLVYSTDRGLYARALDGFESRAIPGTEGAIQPFFSPDGEWVGFTSMSALKKVPIGGGPPVTVCGLERIFAGGASWGRDGTIVYSSGGVLYRVSADGGTPETLTDSTRNHVWPVFLPDGERLLVTESAPGRRVVIYSLGTGESQELDVPGSAHYLSSGHLIYGQPTRLMAVPVDPETLSILGPAVPVVEGVSMSWTGSANYALSDAGTLAYLSREGGKSLVQVSRQGLVKPLSDRAGEYYVPRISPDGTRLAVGIFDPAVPRRDIWIYDLERGGMTRLTLSERDSTDPVWSPDGEDIAFASRDQGTWRLFLKASDGTGEAVELVQSLPTAMPDLWLPDSRSLVFKTNSGSGWDIAVYPLDEDREPEILLGTEFNEIEPSLSPDGRWLAYVSDESGRREVYLHRFPSLEGRWTISTDGGDEPRFSPDGKEIFYRSGDRMMVVSFTAEPQVTFSRPRILFEGRYEVEPFATDARNYDVTPDGQHFVMVSGEEGTSEIRVVVNWMEELKRLVPTDN